MGDMADFIGWNCPDEDGEETYKMNIVENLLDYKDETIYKKCKQIEIEDDYEYKNLCQRILDYYEIHKKLSPKQKVALCFLLAENGIVELEESEEIEKPKNFTPEEFKKMWESDEMGGGITFDDCAKCYVDWGLGTRPKCKQIKYIVDEVCRFAGIKN